MLTRYGSSSSRKAELPRAPWPPCPNVKRSKDSRACLRRPALRLSRPSAMPTLSRRSATHRPARRVWPFRHGHTADFHERTKNTEVTPRVFGNPGAIPGPHSFIVHARRTNEYNTAHRTALEPFHRARAHVTCITHRITHTHAPRLAAAPSPCQGVQCGAPASPRWSRRRRRGATRG